ncbi:NYN domain-containing protein [Streptomyces filamentosus]|uniref:NYN domain-containing protein n=1 Tax=Streptomyces filamentosus TaxID=67294 RepID=A0A919BI52_STRFL|nr:NYN domain-containing protein [Streptomyces filamentosus]GHF91927.1 hypothetical protein GCM10017667_21690 [Streptomyces filamentosus]
MLRTTFIIDYQNVHMTSRDVFDPDGDVHESLIDPVAFARRSITERNGRQRPGYPLAQVERVLVYRGLPHVDYDWEQNRRCRDQATQWRADGAVVDLRDLKYDFQRGADGRPVLDVHGKKIPKGRPREKGIDVLCALACVRESVDPDVDLVVLASRDTDLVPVLDELYDFRSRDAGRYARIETVSWYDPEARKQGRYAGGSLRPSGTRRIWNTNLDRSCYEASLDRRDYQ